MRISIGGPARPTHSALAAAFVAFTAMTIGCGAAAEEPIAAVFKARELTFTYRSDGELACHELQHHVATILRAVGARDDIQVTLGSCDEFAIARDRSMTRDPMVRGNSDRWGDFPNQDERFGSRDTDRFDTGSNDRDQTIYFRIRLMTPVPVTPEVLAEMDRDKSRRALISRVTGNPIAMMNDPIVFAAERQQVSLSARSIRLQKEDCSLLEQLSRSVFREIDVRVVRGGPMCSRGSHIAPNVTVEVLLPSAAPLPKATQGTSEPSAPPASNEQPKTAGDTAPGQ